MTYILSLDQGTTSSRAIVFDRDGQIVSMAQLPYEQHFPQIGWVEHDPLQIWQTQLQAARQAISQCKIAPTELSAIGITNQRETTIVWDRKTGEPIYRAIVWQDRRTADYCDQLKQRGVEPEIQTKTGLLLDAYFSATKIRWILDHVPRARERALNGELAFGTIDTWLTWNLTAGKCHVTDASNACRTLLFNLKTLDWDEQLLALFDIPRQLLPDVVPSDAIVGYSESTLLGASIPLASRVGDQQAATFGQACFAQGDAKNTYGTGCFMLMNTGSDPVQSTNRLITTVGWQLQKNAPTYCLEGSVFMGGATIQWLRDQLGFIENASEVQQLASQVPDSGDVYLVPAFTGMGAPHWDGYARGMIIGMTRGTGKAHIARAALDAIALQVADILLAMQADSHKPLTELKVDGGASASDLLMQIQADLLGISVVRPKVLETTALGAAYMAGLATGVWQSQAELTEHWSVQKRFEPMISDSQRQLKLDRWHEALARAKRWAISESS